MNNARMTRDTHITLLSDGTDMKFLHDGDRVCNGVCGHCKYYSRPMFQDPENFCRKTGKTEIGYLWEKECFTQ